MRKKPDMKPFEKLEDLLRSTQVDSKAHEEIIFNRLKYKIETGTINAKLIEERKSFNPYKAFSISVAALFIVFFAYTNGSLDSIIARLGNQEELIILRTNDFEAQYSAHSIDFFELEKMNEILEEPVGLPQYLPEGYTFEQGKFFEEEGRLSLRYAVEETDKAIVISAFLEEESNKEVSMARSMLKMTSEPEIIITQNSAFWESQGIQYELLWESQDAGNEENKGQNSQEILKIIQSVTK